MKKKIVWITSDCFVDCDFDINILNCILQQYDIDWYILLPTKDSRYKNYDFSQLDELDGLRTFKFKFKHDNGSFMRVKDYWRLFGSIRKEEYDIIYINCPPTPLLLPFILVLDRNKTILTSHQGEVHRGFTHPWKHKLIRFFMYNKVKYINMFSESQSVLMAKHFPKANIFTVNLALKDFGKPQKETKKNENVIEFLSFGTINYGKHIDLLIDAACNVYEKGVKNIRVKIYGQCDNWGFYQKRIRYPEIFDCKIALIDNNDIPDLFCSSHYFVQPYRIVTQSGPLKIAFNYNVPVICSNLPGFSDEVKNGVNGFLFETDDVLALEKKMIKAIKIVENGEYRMFCERMKNYTENNYSPICIGQRYIEMFNQLN